MRNVEGIIIMTCDMPAVISSHIRALAASGGE
jgi:CTP:molybdopterin cytidylyltransferase MocA